MSRPGTGAPVPRSTSARSPTARSPLSPPALGTGHAQHAQRVRVQLRRALGRGKMDELSNQQLEHTWVFGCEIWIFWLTNLEMWWMEGTNELWVSIFFTIGSQLELWTEFPNHRKSQTAQRHWRFNSGCTCVSHCWWILKLTDQYWITLITRYHISSTFFDRISYMFFCRYSDMIKTWSWPNKMRPNREFGFWEFFPGCKQQNVVFSEFFIRCFLATMDCRNFIHDPINPTETEALSPMECHQVKPGLYILVMWDSPHAINN